MRGRNFRGKSRPISHLLRTSALSFPSNARPSCRSLSMFCDSPSSIRNPIRPYTTLWGSNAFGPLGLTLIHHHLLPSARHARYAPRLRRGLYRRAAYAAPFIPPYQHISLSDAPSHQHRSPCSPYRLRVAPRRFAVPFGQCVTLPRLLIF